MRTDGGCPGNRASGLGVTDMGLRMRERARESEREHRFRAQVHRMPWQCRNARTPSSGREMENKHGMDSCSVTYSVFFFFACSSVEMPSHLLPCEPHEHQPTTFSPRPTRLPSFGAGSRLEPFPSLVRSAIRFQGLPRLRLSFFFFPFFTVGGCRLPPKTA